MQRNIMPIDIATLAYIFFQILIVSIFMNGETGWLFILFFYMAAAGIAVIFMVVPVSGNGSIWGSLRVTYPLFLLAFFFQAADPQIFMIIDKPFDSHIYAFETAVFGEDPAFALQPYMEIWLNEIMNLAYLSFYLMMPAACLILYFRRRWEALERLALAGALASYVCLVLFVLFPIVGPRFSLYDHYYLPLIGPVFSPLANIIAGGNEIRGAAFPSSHCALGLVATWVIWREFRKIGFLSAVLLLLICAGSVYGRYSFVSGIIAGIITGWVGLWISGRWRSGHSHTGTIDLDKIKSEEPKTMSR